MAIEITKDCAVRFSLRAPSAADIVQFVLTIPCERYAGLVIAAIELAYDCAKHALT